MAMSRWGNVEFARSSPSGGRYSGALAGILSPRADAERKKKQSSLSSDIQGLADRLAELIDTYGQSESVADRELANIYAGYLRELGKGGTFARKVIKQYQAGYIPGLGRSGGETAPAWS